MPVNICQITSWHALHTTNARHNGCLWRVRLTRPSRQRGARRLLALRGGIAGPDAHGRASRLLDLARAGTYNPGNASDTPRQSDHMIALADDAEDRTAESAEYPDTQEVR
jgi:hypothetical protein